MYKLPKLFVIFYHMGDMSKFGRVYLCNVTTYVPPLPHPNTMLTNYLYLTMSNHRPIITHTPQSTHSHSSTLQIPHFSLIPTITFRIVYDAYHTLHDTNVGNTYPPTHTYPLIHMGGLS